MDDGEGRKPRLRIKRRKTVHEFVTEKNAHRPRWINFATGAAAAVSGWLLVHPMDVVKVRAQLGGKTTTSMLSSTINIHRNEGFKGLYSGLSAAVVRQLTYGNLRLGLYATLKDVMFPLENPSNVQNLSLGLVSGGIAAFLSNPIEVSLVRMQADGRLPEAERRSYKNVFNALGRISRDEGVFALWKGSSPTVARAMVVNAIQVGGYEVAKSNLSLLGIEEGVALHLGSSVISGFAYSLVTLPIDTAKTRMQTQTGKEYRNLIQAISRIAQTEGVMSLWNGFMPYFARCGGHTVTMFLFLEQYKKIASSVYPENNF